MSLTARQRSIHNKNGTKRSTSFKAKRTRKGSEGEFLVTNAPTDLRSVAYPGGAVALAILLTARITSALWGQIHDCDETYNYWEPLHYLVYGTGLQTWEYSPAYAIRSYMSLWLFAVPAKMMSYVMSPVSVFYTIRVTLAVLTASAELMFYKAVCQEFGVHVGRVWLALTAAAAGSAAAAAALLPSAISHALLTAALAAWWRRRPPAAVLLTAASAVLSWPFTALVGAPLAAELVVVRRRGRAVCGWAAVGGAAMLLAAVLVDSYHYGRLVVAPWNIVAYNLFSSRGPDLYGVEPWTYYFVNGFLNFNVVWVAALLTPVLLACCSLLRGAGSRPAFCVSYWFALAPLYCWLGVFVLQPHKEERFLYPVYSMLVLCGAISLDCLQRLTYAVGSEVFRWRQERQRRHYLAYTGPMWMLFVLIAGMAGISRSVALYRNYHGPMSLLQSLPESTSAPTYVCFGAEWHRSPSSFHLPNNNYEIRFIKSDFRGQLPAPYSKLPNATRVVPPHFNDRNVEDSRTYLQRAQCHYMVESLQATVPAATVPAATVPAATVPAGWSVVSSRPLLEPAASHPLARAFYLPIISDIYLHFKHLYLLKNDNPQAYVPID